jgi:hypothetical protein
MEDWLDLWAASQNSLPRTDPVLRSPARIVWSLWHHLMGKPVEAQGPQTTILELLMLPPSFLVFDPVSVSVFFSFFLMTDLSFHDPLNNIIYTTPFIKRCFEFFIHFLFWSWDNPISFYYCMQARSVIIKYGIKSL